MLQGVGDPKCRGAPHTPSSGFGVCFSKFLQQQQIQKRSATREASPGKTGLAPGSPTATPAESRGADFDSRFCF